MNTNAINANILSLMQVFVLEHLVEPLSVCDAVVKATHPSLWVALLGVSSTSHLINQLHNPFVSYIEFKPHPSMRCHIHLYSL